MYEEEIDRGIQLLDEKGPKDWRARINKDTLSMCSGTQCILGQVYSTDNRCCGYCVGKEALDIRDDSKHYGFDLNGFEDFSVYQSLRDEWIAKL